MNGLVTDSQMFALKSIGIPLNGKHPPPIITGYVCLFNSPFKFLSANINFVSREDQI